MKTFVNIYSRITMIDPILLKFLATVSLNKRTHSPYPGRPLCHQFGRERTTESSAAHPELQTE